MQSDPAAPPPDAADPAPDGQADSRHLRRERALRGAWTGVAARVVNMVAQVASLAMTVRYLGRVR